MASDESSIQPQQLDSSQAWEFFLTVFLTVLRPNDPQGIAVYAAINRSLFQFHLQGLYDPAYILHEVYLRALESIWIKQQCIYRPIPWIKGAGYNIVRELSRQEGKTESLEDNQDWDYESQRYPESEFKPNVEYALITLAYQRLTPEDRRILKLCLVDELSYQEIRAIYAADGCDISSVALRKQKSRALKRLRDVYHSLAHQQDCCDGFADDR